MHEQDCRADLQTETQKSFKIAGDNVKHIIKAIPKKSQTDSSNAQKREKKESGRSAASEGKTGCVPTV